MCHSRRGTCRSLTISSTDRVREFAADTPLPTESGLQREYQASRNTIREAIKLLVQQHLVQTKACRGTFITDEIVRFVTVLSTDPRHRLCLRRGSGNLPGACL